MRVDIRWGTPVTRGTPSSPTTPAPTTRVGRVVLDGTDIGWVEEIVRPVMQESEKNNQ